MKKKKIGRNSRHEHENTPVKRIPDRDKLDSELDCRPIVTEDRNGTINLAKVWKCYA